MFVCLFVTGVQAQKLAQKAVFGISYEGRSESLAKAKVGASAPKEDPAIDHAPNSGVAPDSSTSFALTEHVIATQNGVNAHAIALEETSHHILGSATDPELFADTSFAGWAMIDEGTQGPPIPTNYALATGKADSVTKAVYRIDDTIHTSSTGDNKITAIVELHGDIDPEITVLEYELLATITKQGEPCDLKVVAKFKQNPQQWRIEVLRVDGDNFDGLIDPDHPGYEVDQVKTKPAYGPWIFQRTESIDCWHTDLIGTCVQSKGDVKIYVSTTETGADDEIEATAEASAQLNFSVDDNE